jgi:hypothetical protein
MDKFESWWNENKDNYHGSVCDKILMKKHFKTGWDAHKISEMKPIVEEISSDAGKIQDSAAELKDKIEKL